VCIVLFWCWQVISIQRVRLIRCLQDSANGAFYAVTCMEIVPSSAVMMQLSQVMLPTSLETCEGWQNSTKQQKTTGMCVTSENTKQHYYRWFFIQLYSQYFFIGIEEGLCIVHTHASTAIRAINDRYTSLKMTLLLTVNTKRNRNTNPKPNPKLIAASLLQFHDSTDFADFCAASLDRTQIVIQASKPAVM